MRIILLVLLLLPEYAIADNVFNSLGLIAYNRKDYQTAFNQFKSCYEQTSDAVCALNAGRALEDKGDWDNAKNWITLSARYGNSQAISELVQRNWPVPTADLLRPVQQQPVIIQQQQPQQQYDVPVPQVTQRLPSLQPYQVPMPQQLQQPVLQQLKQPTTTTTNCRMIGNQMYCDSTTQ